jgi:hypothetical protein
MLYLDKFSAAKLCAKPFYMHGMPCAMSVSAFCASHAPTYYLTFCTLLPAVPPAQNGAGREEEEGRLPSEERRQ